MKLTAHTVIQFQSQILGPFQQFVFPDDCFQAVGFARKASAPAPPAPPAPAQNSEAGFDGRWMRLTATTLLAMRLEEFVVRMLHYQRGLIKTGSCIRVCHRYASSSSLSPKVMFTKRIQKRGAAGMHIFISYQHYQN